MINIIHIADSTHVKSLAVHVGLYHEKNTSI